MSPFSDREGRVLGQLRSNPRVLLSGSRERCEHIDGRHCGSDPTQLSNDRDKAISKGCKEELLSPNLTVNRRNNRVLMGLKLWSGEAVRVRGALTPNIVLRCLR